MELAQVNNYGRVCCYRIPRNTNTSNYKKNDCLGLRRNKCSLGIKCGIAEPSGEPASMGLKTRYNDNFFDKVFMNLFARKMNQIIGVYSIKFNTGKSGQVDGYEGFVETSRRVMHGRTPKQQQEAVRKVLLSMLPPGAPETFRKLFPPTRSSAEFNAALTVPFFQWLVGPSEVVEVEINGVKQRSGVHIKKCRYLENSGCVGMCVNMCKLPTQDFFTNEFGLPLTMTPIANSSELGAGRRTRPRDTTNQSKKDFEDMSCDMLYGQPPPPPDEDPAFKQPCYAAICSMAQSDRDVCPKLHT